MVRAITGVLVALGLLAVAPAVAAERCAGEKVTISFRDEGVGVNIRGTGGRDVIQGGPQTETIQGNRGDDVICGGDGNDRIGGGPGRDELLGQDGSDRFSGADLGIDIVVGGPGQQFTDLADYHKSPVGIRLNMANGLVLADGAAARGGIQGIERVYGTDHDDQLIGDDRDQSLFGDQGNDVIDGRGGSDAQSGGRGIDRVTYAKSHAAVVVDLRGTLATVGDDVEIDHVGSFEIVIGSRFDDNITGTETNERLEGGPGDDVIKAGHGDDTLQGDAGDDILFPGPGDDYVEGGPNRPVTNVNHPGDLVNYRFAKLEPELVEDEPGKFEEFMPDQLEVCFDTSLCGGRQYPYNASGEGHDVFKEIESVRGMEHKRNDLQGDNGPNVLVGGKKEDYIHGWGGNDHLFGLGFPDNLWGDDGDDYLDPGGDDELMDGGDGTDTCLHRSEDLATSCEQTG